MLLFGSGDKLAINFIRARYNFYLYIMQKELYANMEKNLNR